jgi:pimeloyl-ACP methyl ester carboxylesterase
MTTPTPTQTGYAQNGECRLFYESFGDGDAPTLLLVNGLGSQCINYDVAWCDMFVAAGLQVVRFDNRDVGLSTHFTDAPTDERGAAYTVADMAADAVAVLDAIGVAQAHVMGLSMGGMIVQHLAIHHRDRLFSMTSVMSRTGEAEFGQSTPEALAQLTAPPATDLESAVAGWLAGQRIWDSPGHLDETRGRDIATRAFERAFDPAGVGRQYLAVVGAPGWAEQLPGVTTPTLVMHGTADNLIDVSGGRRTAELIAGARFVALEGMGHDYPPAFWSQWVDEVVGFIRSLDAG